MTFYVTMFVIFASASLEMARLLFPSQDYSIASVAMMLLGMVGILNLVRMRIVIGGRIRAGEAAEEDRLRLLASDALTGALSRGVFLERLRDAVGPSLHSKALLLLVDVDHFKSVNDGCGHAAGDEVLKEIVALARSCFPKAEVGRLGGDEFAILMIGCESPQGMKAAGRFLSELRHPRMIAGFQLSIGCSIGLATAPDHACLVDDLILYADLALYESKRRGRGCATAFDRSMLMDQRHHRFVERELRAAILLDELELHYQPLTDAKGATAGVEALVRWRHSLRGMIAPSEFIGIAEQSTLIDMLGEWVMRRAARDARLLPSGPIGINVSGAQLKRDQLVDMVTRVLAETGCPADRFVFEITESVAVAATPAVLGRLQALRDLGARVSLDDFGTGNCGFQSLRSLPVDGIKIDRSYIQSMEADAVAAIIVSALAAIGRTRDLEIVAEGIETEAHLRLARLAGCTMFQGYLLGRPAPLEELRRESRRRLAG